MNYQTVKFNIVWDSGFKQNYEFNYATQARLECEYKHYESLTHVKSYKVTHKGKVIHEWKRSSSQ